MSAPRANAPRALLLGLLTSTLAAAGATAHAAAPPAATLPTAARAAAAATLPTAARAAAAATVPAAAPATSVATAGVAGPTTTFSEVSAVADCGARLVSGGGTRLAQSTATVQHNGIRLYASAPSHDGAVAALDGDAGPTRWLSSGGSGGGVPSDARTIAYGLCLDAGPVATQVVVASVPGPAGTFQTARSTATCPAGSRLLSGGARTTPGTVGSLKPSGSFPSDATGAPLLAGENPSSWTAVGLNGGGADQGDATHAFAVCATGDSPPSVSISHARVPGPAAASTAAQASVACPAGSALLGGGGDVSDAFGLPGSQGDHLTASNPSDAAGTPIGSGLAAAWTVASHSGGADSGNLTQTDVWALCGRAADAPAPALAPAAGPAMPSGKAAAPPPGKPAAPGAVAPTSRVPRPAGTLFARSLGAGGADAGRAVALDAAGNVYVAGETSSSGFPVTRGARHRRRGATTSAFVAKIDPRGRLVYSTLLGGRGMSAARGIAVDADGRAYVAGATNATDFPTTRSALQRSYGGGPFDAFVTALRPSGAIAYSTFLGDTHYDEANAIAVDRRGRAVVTGRTASPSFPRARALRPPVDAGAFVTKLDRSGSSLVFSAVLGGDDRANHGNTGLGVAVDHGGATYVAGVTNAAAFPTTSRALQPRIGGGGDAFVTKVDAAGRSVVYSTYLGGSADDSARAVAADAAGNAYVAGATSSRDMPLRGAPQPTNAGGADAFVAKLGPRGRALGYATYLGGRGDDGATAIALGARGEAYVTGRMGSGALAGSGAGPNDSAPASATAGPPAGAFVRRLSSSGRSIPYATAIGDAGASGFGIAAGRLGAFAITGIANDHGGDAFVTAIAP